MHYCWLKSSTLFKCSPQPKLLLFVTVVTVVQWSASRKCQKTRVKPENTWGFPGIFGYYPHWTLWRSRRGSLPGLPYSLLLMLFSRPNVSYCCWGAPHCCSVVTVNTSNTVQLLTFDNPRSIDMSIEHPARSTPHVHTRQPTRHSRHSRASPPPHGAWPCCDLCADS